MRRLVGILVVVMGIGFAIAARETKQTIYIAPAVIFLGIGSLCIGPPRQRVLPP